MPDQEKDTKKSKLAFVQATEYVLHVSTLKRNSHYLQTSKCNVQQCHIPQFGQ